LLGQSTEGSMILREDSLEAYSDTFRVSQLWKHQLHIYR